MKELRISVRNLIEFVKRSGDIDRGFYSNSRAMAGIYAHQKLQALYSSSYKKEVFLSTSISFSDFNLTVEGRADGIGYEEKTCLYVIDEIKSTSRDLDELDYDSNILHWAQAKTYAYIYAKNKNLDRINVRLSYFHLPTSQIKKIDHEFSFEELSDFFNELIVSYLEFSKRLTEWKEIRNESIKTCRFPFKNYRAGQREMAVAVYNTISNKNKLFVQAPTGIGKSMSVIFPSIKAIGEDKLDKIFYLVSRSTGKITAQDSLFKLMDRGLRIKYLTLTAKEKICINDEVKCNPKDCPFAKGHFDRVNDAIIDIFDSVDEFKRSNIEKYSKLHLICPFEFQLDLANFSDFIIGDYNYAFDPIVYLKRFFEGSLESYVFLVDEAHNLVDRAREMYSAEFKLNDLMLLDEYLPKSLKIDRANNLKVISEFNLLAKTRFFSYQAFANLNEALEKLMYSLNDYLIKYKEDEHYDEILNIYFNLFSYNKIYQYYNKDFVSLKEENTIKILCLDSGDIFKDILKNARASVFFSATLEPLKYYGNLLGADENTYYYKIKSPFDTNKLLVLRDKKILTTYKYRKNFVADIVRLLKLFTEKKGNYIFFFPSYAYMEMVYEEYKKIDEKVIIQSRQMTETDRSEFLLKFKFQEDLRAFAVMGGAFSEGIDLLGKRLIGVAIISVGIPQISFERNILKNHFQKKLKKGYDYAYIYPGMVKVNQSGGRVIRSEDDKGVVLLIDKRFSIEPYSKLLPSHWIVEDFYSDKDIKKRLGEFWEE